MPGGKQHRYSVTSSTGTKLAASPRLLYEHHTSSFPFDQSSANPPSNPPRSISASRVWKPRFNAAWNRLWASGLRAPSPAGSSGIHLRGPFDPCVDLAAECHEVDWLGQ